MTLSLKSTSFNEGDRIPEKHHMSEAYGLGCSGGNVSPELHWDGIPEGTKSIVIQCFDPDAPTGSGFWHWVVTNISPDTTSIAEGDIPSGALETRTDTSGAIVGFMTNMNAIEQAKLTGIVSR